VHSELLLRVVDLAAQGDRDLFLRAAQQDLGAALGDEPAEGADQQAGRDQGERDDAQLQRASPGPASRCEVDLEPPDGDTPISPQHPQGAADRHGQPGGSAHLAARLARRCDYAVPAL
jgi:hypothetical protein